MLPLRYRLLKRADRTVGRWLCGHLRPAAEVAADGLVHAAPPVPAEAVRRLLVVRPGGLGDAVLTYPMLRALRAAYPEAELEVLAERRNAGVYAIEPVVGAVHRYDVRPVSTLRALRARRFDLVVDTEQYHYLSTLVANALAPRWLAGFDTIGRGRMQTHRVRYTDTEYEAYLFLALARAVTGRATSFDPDAPFLTVAPEWLEWADGALARRGERPVAVIVPSASSEHRVWPGERYAGVVRWLVERGLYAVLLGGDDAVEAARGIARGFGPDDVLDLAGRTTLPQTAGAIARARIYVSTDTGALHVAYGVGTPTVHMFGSGIQQKWAPPGRRYRVVSKNLPCSPCTRYGYTPPCPYHVECMSAIEVGDVTRAIAEVLEL